MVENRKNRIISANIYFDTSILIGQSTFETETQQRKLKLLASRNHVEFLTTDITRIEVAKSRAERACNKLKPLADDNAVNLAANIFGVQIPILERDSLHEKAFYYYLNEITEKTSAPNWRCLECRHVILSNVFAEYGKKKGFFREGAKREQFKDAIVFEMLKGESSNETPVIIFSRDRDFDAVNEYSANVQWVKSWAELIESLGITESIPELEDIVCKYRPYIEESVHQRLWEEWEESVHQRLWEEWEESLWEEWDKGMSKYIQEEMPEITLRKDEMSGVSGIKHGDDSMIFGDMRIFFDLPVGIRTFIPPHWRTFREEVHIESKREADAVCDISFMIILSEQEAGKISVMVEIEYKNGFIHYASNPLDDDA